MQDIAALSQLIESAQKLAEQKEKEAVGSTQRQQHDQPRAQQERLRQKVEESFGMDFKTPQYEVIYKQQVEASEVYGGFQQMTPSSMDSQFLVIRIKLPNENVKNVDVELTEQTLTLFSKYHRLHLELPHPIIESTARAKWSRSQLEITVRRKDIE